jgi:hypothetical protein
MAVLVLPLALFAQEFRGTISGMITDPTGAMVAGAKVTVTETNTGTRIPTVSGASGEYTAAFLLPGDYDITVELQGFKGFFRRGVHVGAGDHAVIDVRLEVGDVATTLEVTEDASLLTTDTSTVGQAITTKEVAELPINGRTPMMAAALALGVVGYAQPTLVHPFDSGAAAGWSVGGAYQQTSELLVNGSPNATWDGRLAYSPPQDAVQEVRVKASDTDAAFGHTAGGTLNQITKSGTNSFHGSAWEFNQPNTLTANDFFLNQKGQARPVTHLNQYGVTAGGPVLLPKVFNGRNKLFWFFAWEGMKDAQPNPVNLTVPSDAERGGNFAQMLVPTKANPQGTKLYDPYTAVVSGSNITRTQFPNNQIPQVAPYVNPVAQAYLKFIPKPNAAGLEDGTQNYITAPNTPDNFSNEMGRIDYNMNDNSRMFFDVRHTDYTQIKNNYFNNISTGSLLFRTNTGISVDEVYTVNPTNILDVRFNFTRMNEGHDVPSVGFNPTTLGFPAYMAANSQYLALPVLTFATSSFQTLGNTGTGADRLPSQSGQIFATWVKIKGSHTLKFGGDFRQYRLNTFTAGNSAGTFSFSGNNYVRETQATSSSVVGQDFAEFLMGLPTGGSYDLNTFGSWYSYYSSVFVQDDWRVTRNLTLNLGLRFDHDGPYNEKYGRTVNGFDTTSASPLQAAAQAAYARAPIAQLPANAFNVLGGLTFPGNGTAVYNNNSHLVSPRVGFAWTPEQFHGKTVIRAGFGMFVAPVSIARMDVNGKFSTSPETNQEGFSQSTTIVPTSNNYASPAATLSNPFPSGLLAPSGSSLGLLTFAGQAITFINPNMSSPYSLRWNFGIQQSLTPNLMLEVAYIGNHSVHLPVDATQLNGMPRQFLSTLGVRDPAQNYLATTAANPFFGLQTSTGTAANTTPAQLLARYPQFPVGDSASGWNGNGGIIEQNASVGSSYFNSLNVRLQKRTSHGLNLTANYIFSKLIERVTWLNDSDPAPEKRISSIDHPHRFVAAISYELPVGRNKLVNLQSRWMNSVLGGWQLNGVYTYQVGAPINWNNGSTTSPGDYVYFGAPLVLNNRMADPGSTAFNVSAFDTKSADAFQYHIRTFPTMISGLRMDGINQFDPSLLKRVSFTEKAYLQLRFEAFNALNHPVFPAPNTTASGSSFGTISGAQANRPRSIQLGARLVF